MKKINLLGISLMALIFFAATSSVNAQWSYKVVWDDSECSCGEIVKKTVEWTLYEFGTTNVVEYGAADVTNGLGNSYTIDGYEILQEDARFTLCVRVFYTDASLVNPCCKAQKCIPTDSGLLTSTPPQTIYLILE